VNTPVPFSGAPILGAPVSFFMRRGTIRRMWRAFWDWYERTYTLNVSIALGLFLVQIIHLAWLSGEVVWAHLFGAPLFVFSGVWENIIVLVDYTEIPAILSVSLVYVHELRQSLNFKSGLYLFLLNIQLLHIFWITDEFVETSFNSAGTVFPLWLAYIAIAIDYLELPVMLDTCKKFAVALRERRVGHFLKTELREEE
jgi:hypothetical protein